MLQGPIAATLARQHDIMDVDAKMSMPLRQNQLAVRHDDHHAFRRHEIGQFI